MWILNLDSEKAVRELEVATESEVKKIQKTLRGVIPLTCIHP